MRAVFAAIVLSVIAAPLASGAKVVMSGTLSDGHSLQARFVIP